jgi:hypothetical protein
MPDVHSCVPAIANPSAELLNKGDTQCDHQMALVNNSSTGTIQKQQTRQTWDFSRWGKT